ncbi:GDP-mannose 4,6-dehydratase [Variovorax ginsengisoli]|uniref:Nucleoside-diphosphate-sugar epimerase n=1 Tax=Variovorax ginsengisoli TaxID=363844 RepID=A0ABT9SB32_9BURK|nr:GDP-mannose 4,6-dehydratase [Variovorax ginsengisoli]MDP9901571.1 nucleoside-diphosphate-sugar epimerase [Variovorax ginsengisoli]
MKIFLTGAEGFTGRYFSDRASAAGHEVVSMRADLMDRDALADEVRSVQPEVVVHLAAISFVGHADSSSFYAVNVVGTTNLLEALLLLPTSPHRVLLASSANIYGNSEQSPLTEAHPPAPVNHYATSKLAMEYMAKSFAGRLNLVVARPFNYTGRGQDVKFVIPKIAKHFSEKASSISLGNLDVEREFNDVQTVCDAYLCLMEFGQPGENYNVCSGRPHSLREVIACFERITGHAINVEVNPAFVRKNEVRSLCGDPGKLNALLSKSGANIVLPTLQDTLARML